MNNLPQIVIGCFLVDNQSLDKAIEAGARTEMFGHLGPIFDLCVKTRTSGEGFDEFSLIVKGANAKDIAECSAAAPTTYGFKDALDRLIWNAKKSKIEAVCKDFLKELKVSGPDEADVIAGTLGQMQEMAQTKDDGDERIPDVIDAILADLDAELANKPKDSIEIRWGIPDADRFMLPIQGHELVILAARPSQAKSSLALHVAQTALRDKRRVVIFTLETSKKAVLKQIASQAAGVDLRNIGLESKEKIGFFKDCLARLKEITNLVIYDRITSLEGIESRCRLLATSFKPHLVIIDYLGLIRVRGKNSLYEQMSEAAKALIEARKALGCAMIALHQLNRGSARDEREPELYDLKDSSEIEQAACRAVFLYRPKCRYDTETPQQREGQVPPTQWHTMLLQKKLRDGPLAAVRTVFNAPTTQFLSYESNTKF